MPSNTKVNVLRSFSGSKCAIKPMASGSIMAAVAVLLIHMERNAVTAKISITAVNKLPRDRAMTCKAIFLSSR